MAGPEVHRSQAEHNKATAKKLLEQQPHHDWAITAAFYAAIHYFECWLFKKYGEHTETTIPINPDGKLEYTAHGWREQLIKTHLSRKAFTSFRKLRSASETARYLSLSRLSPRSSPDWIRSPASEYFSVEQARELVEEVLCRFVEELGIDPSSG